LGKIFDALEKSKLRLEDTSPPAAKPAVDREPRLGGKGTAGQSKRFRGFEKSSAPAFQETINDAEMVKPEAGADAASDPFNGRRLNNNLITLLNPRSYEAEQFKILRTSLLFPSSGRPARSIMVTSALPGEGKSFVAANLAISIAQNINEHVLLMDCDLRKPTIQRYFGFGQVPGMSDYLGSEKPLTALLLKTGIDKLTLLPAGKPPDNPSELLSSNKMWQLLDEVKTRYPDRYIVMDSPPPKLTAETSALAKQVDGVLIVVKYGSTAREASRDLIQHLGREKILGVVLNWMDLRSLDSYHYGAYKNYSNYYNRP